tara:strand:+ start:1162 stop:1521 length:360 start_codon:yes stop_codon:yes gene_type:complete
MEAICHDCKCSKKLNSIPLSELPFREGMSNGFGFGHKACIVTTKVITTKINLDSDFFSKNVFSRNHPIEAKQSSNSNLKDELNVLMNHIDEGSADKRAVMAKMRSPKAAAMMRSPSNKN